jgi:hypothetical protein
MAEEEIKKTEQTTEQTESTVAAPATTSKEEEVKASCFMQVRFMFKRVLITQSSQ